jgi:hypothetical protein
MSIPNNFSRPAAKPLSPDERAVSDTLDRVGYARVDVTFVGTDNGDATFARHQFLEAARDNPQDDHSKNGERRRRYGVFIFHPWAGMLDSLPPVWDPERKEWVTRYLQSATLNPEQNGAPRAFAPLTEGQRTNLFLRSTIKKCYRALPWHEYARPIIVGVHIIQLIARPNSPGISSPNFLHRDGEPWTWAFLIERYAVVGGENFIAAPEVANRHPNEVTAPDLLARFTLEQPFEGWVVNDSRVSHYVAPVFVADGYEVGWRTILLIDFSPAIPGICQ